VTSGARSHVAAAPGAHTRGRWVGRCGPQLSRLSPRGGGRIPARRLGRELGRIRIALDSKRPESGSSWSAAFWPPRCSPPLVRRQGFLDAYGRYRANLGRAILLGLELLVAGDIISTLLVVQTLESVGVLAVIVSIRTFLSFSLETEIEGTLPWRRREAGSADRAASR
jgi:hypothetical protein